MAYTSTVRPSLSCLNGIELNYFAFRYEFPPNLDAVQIELHKIAASLRDLRSTFEDICKETGVEHESVLTYGHTLDNGNRICLKCKKERAELSNLKWDGYANLDEDENMDVAEDFSQEDADDVEAMIAVLSGLKSESDLPSSFQRS